MDGLMTSTFHGCVMMVAMVCKAFIYMLGFSVLVAGVTFLFLGPLTWNYSTLTWWFERRTDDHGMEASTFHVSITSSFKMVAWKRDWIFA
jgi:hypothetical protein